MKTLITWIIIFVLGFILGAGVGFKVLEGVSGDLLMEARGNSYQQFQQSYSGSAAQKQLDQKVEEQKAVLMDQIKKGFKDYIMGYLKIGSTGEIIK